MKKNHALLQDTAPPAASVFDAERWGLPREAVQDLGRDLPTLRQKRNRCLEGKKFLQRIETTQRIFFSPLGGFNPLAISFELRLVRVRLIQPPGLSNGQASFPALDFC
ncbi:hypothetical protein HUU40_24625 [candidate division KSB1 bacterium]|nr:hypothetical protein [candidate division KSB1 bacterium]